jgi:hypothetical protein
LLSGKEKAEIDGKAYVGIKYVVGLGAGALGQNPQTTIACERSAEAAGDANWAA